MIERKIKLGLLKTTTVNFPGHLATAIFLPGCNLRCDYCYNTELACSDLNGAALENSENEYFSLEEVFAHLEKRRKVISALAISGGEPFFSPHLEKIIEYASKLNYKIKIDTNGLFPEKLSSIISLNDAITMIALDLKTAPSRYYELLPGKSVSKKELCEKKILSSISLLRSLEKEKKLKVEYRSVLVPGLLGKSEIIKIGKLLPKNADWEFARFLPGNCLNPRLNTIKAYSEEEISELLSYAKNFVSNARLR